jgi:hypothetical protein
MRVCQSWVSLSVLLCCLLWGCFSSWNRFQVMVCIVMCICQSECVRVCVSVFVYCGSNLFSEIDCKLWFTFSVWLSSSCALWEWWQRNLRNKDTLGANKTHFRNRLFNSCFIYIIIHIILPVTFIVCSALKPGYTMLQWKKKVSWWKIRI